MKSSIGDTYNRLTVIGTEGPYLICSCACGGQKRVLGKSVRNGGTRSCGCLQREHLQRVWPQTTKPGDRFGRLTVTSERSRFVRDGYVVDCACDCGTKSHTVRVGSLHRGKTRSCGCLRRETAARVFRELAERAKEPAYA